MHKLLVSLAAAGMMLVAQTAYAESVSGVIESVDFDSRVVVLEDGTAYVAPEEMDIDVLDEGLKVDIEFETSDDENRISDLVIVE